MRLLSYFQECENASVEAARRTIGCLELVGLINMLMRLTGYTASSQIAFRFQVKLL